VFRFVRKAVGEGRRAETRGLYGQRQGVRFFRKGQWPHNPATRFRPPSATVVSAEPFSHWTGTLRCLQKEMATYRHWSVSLWRDPDYVLHCRILSPDKTEWRLISATLCGWRRCFEADQLWLMLRIREEEQEVKVIWQKAPHGEPIPRLGVTPGGRKLYHWIPGVGFPISVP